MTAGDTIGFIGAGNMAEAIIAGLVAQGTSPESLIASAPRNERREALQTQYRIQVVENNVTVAKTSSICVLCTKPHTVDAVLDEIKDFLKPDTLLLSVAAGIRCQDIELKFPNNHPRRVVRAMPNTPTFVAHGATAICAGAHATSKDMEDVTNIFEAVGICVTVPESNMDAATGLSGSGPAFIFMVLEALIQAGVNVGLSHDNATSLATQTVEGASKLLRQTGESPRRLIENVTSPGGPTLAGLDVLETANLSQTLIRAVEASATRAKEMEDE